MPPISPGTKIGPYEVVGHLGAGGMGEVFRARDPRLGRTVAIKVLPPEFAGDAGRLARFEQEARAASALNHPNIITVHDVGSAAGTPYLTMELVEGKSLREVIGGGALPVRKLLDIAVQIADGLAKAHDAGIVHRDLKPENIMISGDGFVKILDFGLAKLVSRAPSGDESTTLPRDSSAGTLLGTVGYMSPEQAAGQRVDFRSDQFSFGTIAYEMATGIRPFKRDTAAETLTAIIREEPEPIEKLNAAVPAPLRWIVERCLEKDPDGRYASTKDLARDLRSIREHISEAEAPHASTAKIPRRRIGTAIAMTAVVALIAAAAAFWAGRRAGQTEPPRFKQMTFRRGTIWNVRFAPDGHLLYSASWDGMPSSTFDNEPDNPEARAIGLSDTGLLAVSSKGMLAVVVRPRWNSSAFERAGTLAEIAIGSSAAPREILDNVREADWTPDGNDLLVVRDVGGECRLELPIGHVIFRTSGWISSARISRDGSRIAMALHPVLSDDGGTLTIIDRAGKKIIGSEDFQSLEGAAWSSDDREVWLTASKDAGNRFLYAMDRTSGKVRFLASAPGSLTVHDITADGRVAATTDETRMRLFEGTDQGERELTWFDWTLPGEITPDGKQLVFSEAGEGGGTGYSVFLRSTDGSPAVRLGQGVGMAVSPDRQFVVSLLQAGGNNRGVALYPTGPGQPRIISHAGLDIQSADVMPDGTQLVITANEPGHATRLYLQDIAGNAPRPFTTEGYRQCNRVISPDGKWVAARGPDMRIYLCPTAGGMPRLLPTLTPTDQPCGWNEDGTAMYVYTRGVIPAEVYRVDVSSGVKTLWKTMKPYDPAGIIDAGRIWPTPDGRTWLVSYFQRLSDLYLMKGVR